MGRISYRLDSGLVILCVLSIWCIPDAGRRLGEPDHGQIVIDEWAGMWLTAFGLNTLTDLTVWMGLLIGFIGFRIFDIAKPWAVSWCERKIPGAWGVLMEISLRADMFLFLPWSLICGAHSG